MSSVIEIERAVEQLSPEELRAFRQWFTEREAVEWDRQFEADVAVGRLDELGKEARTFGERFAKFKGAASGLPSDLAAQHDHYRLRTDKR